MDIFLIIIILNIVNYTKTASDDVTHKFCKR